MIYVFTVFIYKQWSRWQG